MCTTVVAIVILPGFFYPSPSFWSCGPAEISQLHISLGNPLDLRVWLHPGIPSPGTAVAKDWQIQECKALFSVLLSYSPTYFHLYQL